MTSSKNAAQEVTYALAASATLPAKLWRQNSEVNSPVVELSGSSSCTGTAESTVWLAKRCAPTKVRAPSLQQNFCAIQFVFLWYDVSAYCSAHNGPISIPIEILDSWVHY